MGAATWWVYEVDEDNIVWAFVNLGDARDAESGTVSLDELIALRLPFGMTIELDRHFPIGQVGLQEVIDKVKGV